MKPADVVTRLRDAIADNRQVAFFVAVAVLVRLVFWLVTDRVWEDALITVTHARNAVSGIGLTHHPGEPVTHGFTSAVSVLVPLAGEVVVRGSGIFVLKVASIVAAAFTIVFAARICGRLGLSQWPTALVLLYLAVDQNHIFYGMAGMETQIAVMVLLWSVDALMVSGPGRIGLTHGLSILTRPDFLMWVGAATLDLGARNWRGAVKALVVAGLVVAPWIAFTTLYYGSPIPNTILAKSAHFVPAPPGADPIALVGWVVQAFSDRVLGLVRTFTPFFEDTLATGAPLPLGLAFFVSIIVWILAVAGAARTWRVPGWRAAVLFAAGFTAYRLILLPGAYFDWYVPPHSAILIILAAVGIQGLRPLPQFDPRPVVALVLAALLAIHLPFTTGLERKYQQVIENDVRREVGLELGRLMVPGEVLVTESAGYYEFYSNATMYDYPGLTSPTARRAIQSRPPDSRGIEGMIESLQPDWMALRPDEWKGLQQLFPDTAARYDLVRTVQSPEGAIEFDEEARPRVEFWGYRKDASAWQILIIHRTR